MNWEALGALAEILGAIAVITTLGYLAVQIRKNTRLTTTSIYESAMDGYVELNRTLLEADVGEICFKSLNEPEALTEIEVFRFSNLHRMWLAHIYKLYRLYEKGVLPQREWDATAVDVAKYVGQVEKLHYQFQEDNPFFNDLYVEIDRIRAAHMETIGTECRGA